MSVNTSGFSQKMNIAQGELGRVIPLFIRDAAQWIGSRLTDEVLNGVAGTNYPKTYPGSIRKGARGFVGVVSSNLRNSIRAEEIKEFEWQVTQVIPSIAPYIEEVLSKVKSRYGKDFYEIAIQLYGPKIQAEFAKLLRKYLEAIEKMRRVRYSNPFPA